MAMADGVEEGRATLCVIMACVLVTGAVGCVLTVRGCVDNDERGTDGRGSDMSKDSPLCRCGVPVEQEGLECPDCHHGFEADKLGDV